VLTPPTAQGGALRSQDLRTTGDPTSLDGAILRVNPDTGAASAGNPNAASSDLNARRIVAHGLRNPFRITVRPGTNEVFIGDVGWNTWEEVNVGTREMAGVTDGLATVMSTLLITVEQLADAPTLADDLRPIATAAVEAAQRASALARRLNHLVHAPE
jgi:hypothetical protein